MEVEAFIIFAAKKESFSLWSALQISVFCNKFSNCFATQKRFNVLYYYNVNVIQFRHKILVIYKKNKLIAFDMSNEISKKFIRR